MQLTLQSIPLTETLRYALGAKAPDPLPDALAASARSEEHTSELQSR